MIDQYTRTRAQLGTPALDALRSAHVAVFGIGGVGGQAVEVLARSGVGELSLFDSDTVALSNLNRQLVALHSTLGLYKVDAMAARIADIDPTLTVHPNRMFYNAETADSVDLTQFDYVLDCIDTVSAKLLLIRRCKEAGVPFHTDAVQAVGHLHINVKEENIDMLSLSGHKFHAPKGVGALYCRRGVKLGRFIEGGGQERGLRSGTENIASIVALGEAARLKRVNMERESAYVGYLSQKLIEGVLKLPQTILTGHPTQRLPGTCSFCINAIEGESLVLRLDMNGICASTGSACSTGSLDPSHVLLGIGLSHEISHGSLRLTLGPQNTEEDVDYILERLTQVVETLRAMSPIWKA